MNKKSYIKKTARKLSCSREKRNEFTRQLSSDIESALESGENWETIQKRLGTPAEIAKEINESLDDTTIACHQKKVRILRLELGAAAVAFLCLLLFFTMWIRKETKQPEQAHNASPQATQTKELLSDKNALSLSIETIEQFNAGDYNAVCERSDNKLKASLSTETLQQVKEQFMPDAGEFESVENSNTIRITEKTGSYVTVQTQIRYTKQTVTFTLSWNDRKELCGFYLK